MADPRLADSDRSLARDDHRFQRGHADDRRWVHLPGPRPPKLLRLRPYRIFRAFHHGGARPVPHHAGPNRSQFLRRIRVERVGV